MLNKNALRRAFPLGRGEALRDRGRRAAEHALDRLRFIGKLAPPYS